LLTSADARVEAEFFNPQEAERRSRRYENAISTLRSSLEQIKTACEKGEKIARQALRQNPAPNEQEKILASLDSINSLISSSEVKEIAGFLFPQQAIEETAPQKDAFRGYMESLVNLYRSLMAAAQTVEL